MTLTCPKCDTFILGSIPSNCDFCGTPLSNLQIVDDGKGGEKLIVPYRDDDLGMFEK